MILSLRGLSRLIMLLYFSVLRQSLMPNQNLSLGETDSSCVEWFIPEIAGQTYTKTHFKVSTSLFY